MCTCLLHRPVPCLLRRPHRGQLLQLPLLRQAQEARRQALPGQVWWRRVQARRRAGLLPRAFACASPSRPPVSFWSAENADAFYLPHRLEWHTRDGISDLKTPQSVWWIEFVSATLQSEAQRLQQVLQNVPEALRQGVQFGLPEHPGRRMACIPAMAISAPSPGLHDFMQRRGPDGFAAAGSGRRIPFVRCLRLRTAGSACGYATSDMHAGRARA